MKGSLGGLIRGMNVVHMLDEPEFLLLFSCSVPFIIKFRTMPRFQWYVISERVKVNFIPEYWGLFVIRDILNGDKGYIEHHVILRVNIICGKVQYQRDVTEMSRTITKKDTATGIWLPEGNLLTIRYIWIKYVHRTPPNMERA